MSSTEPLLNDEIRDAIRAYFPKYPNRRAVVLPALHVVQERLGYVPTRAVVEIAGLLDLHPSEVQDTLSFYGFFKQDQPQGKVRVWVCRSISCSACGGEDLLEALGVVHAAHEEGQGLGIDPARVVAVEDVRCARAGLVAGDAVIRRDEKASRLSPGHPLLERPGQEESGREPQHLPERPDDAGDSGEAGAEDASQVDQSKQRAASRRDAVLHRRREMEGTS